MEWVEIEKDDEKDKKITTLYTYIHGCMHFEK